MSKNRKIFNVDWLNSLDDLLNNKVFVYSNFNQQPSTNQWSYVHAAENYSC